MKKRAQGIFCLIMLLLTAAGLSVCAGAAGVKPTSVTAVGPLNRTMTVGQEMDLEVRTTPQNADDHQLRWKIVSGSKCVAFQDRDTNDDEIEIRAKKAGTAKIQCSINGASDQKVTFKITVKKTALKAKSTKKKTIYVGDDAELKVSSNAPAQNLKWSIASKYKKIVAFEDYNRYGDDIDVIGLKAGTAKVVCTNTLTKQKVTFTVVVKKRAADYNIQRKGSQSRTVGLGDDVELEVQADKGLKKSDLKWKIADTRIAAFDGGNTGDDVEVRGKKTGSTKVTCTNKKTGKSVVFQVKVVAYHDDDND